MRRIKKPKFNETKVLEKCLSGMTHSAKKDHITLIKNSLHEAASLYLKKAKEQQLYTLPATHGKDTATVFGNVTKKELKSLYTSYMRKKGKPAREIYDTIRHSQKICPLCDVGHVKTLDHYLPQAKFPEFSIVTHNLVPACRDCNFEKKSAFAKTLGEQSFHPYFIESHFIDETWLSATLLEKKRKTPVCVTYKTSPPTDWTDEDKERAKSHFDGLELAERFGVEAGKELCILNVQLKDFKKADHVRKHLKERLKDEKKINVNSWRGALYKALRDSHWYCSQGYKLHP